MRTAILLMLLPTALVADTLECPDNRFTVAGAGLYADRVCRVAGQAAETLAACHLPITREVRIEITREMEENCVGLYHCGKDRVEILHPEALEPLIADSALFSTLATFEYFDSIVFHERGHAAYDDVPCPFDSCTATSEYLAYALQIRALGEALRSRIGLYAVPDEKVSRDRFSAVMVLWAPDRYAVNAWTHLMQRPDPCGYVRGIAAGDILFDTETPFILSPPE